MELRGHREVEAVLFARIESPQEFERFPALISLSAYRLGSTQCEVTHGA
jgi:hypothetical protein